MRVFVPGATRGIGRAIAEAISARGGKHVLFLGCRDAQRGAAPQLRLVVGRYAATAARYAARRPVPLAAAPKPRRGHDVVPLRGTGMAYPSKAFL